MKATVTTLFNEFPEVFLIRIIISFLILISLYVMTRLLYNHKIIDRTQKNALLVLSIYVVVMLYFTVIGRYSYSYYRYELNVLDSYRQLFENINITSIKQITINLFMLMPVGFLLSLIIKGKFRYLLDLIISILLTLLIEFMQFFTRCGTFEVDDIINNTIGAVAGILIYICINGFVKAKISGVRYDRKNNKRQ